MDAPWEDSNPMQEYVEEMRKVFSGFKREAVVEQRKVDERIDRRFEEQGCKREEQDAERKKNEEQRLRSALKSVSACFGNFLGLLDGDIDRSRLEACMFCDFGRSCERITLRN